MRTQVKSQLRLLANGQAAAADDDDDAVVPYISASASASAKGLSMAITCRLGHPLPFRFRWLLSGVNTQTSISIKDSVDCSDL